MPSNNVLKELMTPEGLNEAILRRSKLWKPRHDRMDKWMQMYLLYDAYQDNKPLGHRRFVSNEPMTIVDTCHRVISRFPIQWQIAIDRYSKTTEDEADKYGDIERALYGFMEDIDEDLQLRGEQVARKIAAYHGLLRGMIACKIHLTKEAGRESNVVYVPYDPRFVLPAFGNSGLVSFIAMTPMLAEEVSYEYPDKVPDNYQPDAQVMKIEVWDKTKMGVAITGPNSRTVKGWLIPPTDHNAFGTDGVVAKGKLNKLPFVIRDVNGLPIAEKPNGTWNSGSSQLQALGVGQLTDQSIPGMLRRMMPGQQELWRTTKQPIAERGRSILASIEKHAPQFNEAVASVWQNFSIDTYGVYYMTTRNGQIPDGAENALGSGGIISGERGDSLQRFAPVPMNSSGMTFLNILAEERQKGTISGVLQALGEFRSGFLQARMEQVALNALEPYLSGHNSWASGVGQLIIDQVANGQLDDKKSVMLSYQKVGSNGNSRESFTRIEFEPKSIKEYGRCVIKGEAEPALPVDMMERANIASILLNGRRPIVSRSTVQEDILRRPDPQRENDRIWEDTAQTDPIVVMEELALGLERLGKHELAKVFRDRESMMLAMQMLQQIQVQMQLGALGGGMGGGANGPMNGLMGMQSTGGGSNREAGGPGGVGPESSPPEMTGQGREQQQMNGGM